MNRLVALIVMVCVAFVVNHVLQRKQASQAAGRASAPAPEPRTHRLWPPLDDETQDFHCDGRQYCSQMTSRAEAVYFTRHCPGAKMDGDHDGIPCENDSRF